MDYDSDPSAPIGKVVQKSKAQDNAMAYLAGHMGYHLDVFHIKKRRISLKDCEVCGHVLGPYREDLHQYTKLMDIRKISDEDEGALTYCSSSFIRTITTMEKTFLYYFNRFGHLQGFTWGLQNVMVDMIPLTQFCEPDIKQFFLRKFIRMRTRQSLDKWNKEIRERSYADQYRTTFAPSNKNPKSP